jgi:hypothetical protein
MVSRSLCAAVVGVFLASLLVASFALADNVRIVTADQNAARLMVVQRVDLGSVPGWVGGAVQLSPSSKIPCAPFEPTPGGLVLTGVAGSFFRNTGLQFDSRAQVLKTERLVRLDWSHNVTPRAALGCLRKNFTSHLRETERLVSFGRVGFPRIGDQTAAFRAVVDLTAPGQRVRLMVEIVLFSVGRAELNLTTTAALSAAASVRPAEVALARDMAGRAATALGAA